ncbi:MAG: sulfurtransferase [Rhodoferax sp.]
MTSFEPIVSVQAVQSWLAQGRPLVVFDVSFELGQPAAGDAQYRQRHLAGARRADLERDLSAAPGTPAASGGRHPLPTRAAFAAWLGRQGVTPEHTVVVYDRQGSMYCGRLWWMLKWLGHGPAYVLDGGLAAWDAAGGPTEAGDAPAVMEQNYPLAQTGYAMADTKTIASRLGRPDLTLVDARATPRFRGEVEPLDPVAGHIPGALNRPFADNFLPDGRFKPAAVLRQEWDAVLAGRNPADVIHHCGSGVSAVPNLIAMELAGFGPTTLYPGSWSEWCADPARPVAQG